MSEPIVVDLGPLAQIAQGQGKCFEIKGQRVAVFHGRDGKVYAIQHTCPHRGGPLADGLMGDGLVICPNHGHKFNLSTGEGSEPGERVKVYPARIVNGMIQLEFLA